MKCECEEWKKNYSNMPNWDFCPYCGADIRKSEEKPLIVKSGGTWVFYLEGVDYLWTGEYEPEVFGVIHYDDIYKLHGEWQDFRDIILDDTIAKLRPIINTSRPGNEPILVKLYGVVKDINHPFIGFRQNDSNLDLYSAGCRLATAQELENNT